MILFNGKLFDDSEQDKLIRCLPLQVMKTMAALDTERVIRACDCLARRVISGEFNDTALPILERLGYDLSELGELAVMFTEEALRKKCSVELGGELSPINGRIRRRYPLGTILHIAAGNMDVLPAYSAVEGLLSGNINVLKLPSADSGLSVFLLRKLIEEEPILKDYIYVFDVPSSDVRSIQMLAAACNAVTVWGGDEAVAAVRKLCPPDMKIIEWGHKLSFAYAESDAADDELYCLAEHICRTNGLLCSSCQGIFVDTHSRKVQLGFAERFFEILKAAAEKVPALDIGIRGRNTLAARTAELEGTSLYGGGVAVITPADSRLEISPLYRNVWVKRLPLENVYSLKQYKMHLQTASVLTADTDKKRIIAEKLAECGIVRILRPENMSQTLIGEAHDGRYALCEYSRIVEFDENVLKG